MGHRDLSAIAVAALALLMASATWVTDALAPAAGHLSERALNRASAQALETQPAGQPVSWRDPDSGIVATIAATAAFRDTDGRWCRAYTIAFRGPRDGEVPRRGISCRGTAGRWSPDRTAQQLASADPGGFDRWFDRLTDMPAR